MKRLCLGLSLTVMAAANGTAGAETQLTILSTNDIDQFAALAGLSGVVAAERAARDQVLFLHAGDSYSPSILAVWRANHRLDVM